MLKDFHNMNEVVDFKNVSFCYPGCDTKSVTKINLKIKKGEFIVLAGESGCGKTTITRLINGLAEKFYEGKTEGTILVNGKNLSEIPLCEIGKTAGTIFQDPKSQFFASLTEDEVAFGCENYGISEEIIDEKVKAAIKKINGEMLCGKRIHFMSSGEKQKIAIASVYAVDPPIYIFDEPSANLDMSSVEALKALMKKLKMEGHTIVVAEHRLYYLSDLADRILYLKNGYIEHEWNPQELMEFDEEERAELGIRTPNLKNLSKDRYRNKERELSLEVRNLSFAYEDKQVFHHLSFQAFKGDIIALTGANGVGKTTLSGVLCGMQKEKEGEIFYDGFVVSRRKRKDKAYFVMQNTDCQLFGDSLEEELLLNGRKREVSEADKVLDIYGLSDLREKHSAALSGGQKQRLTLAVSDWIDTPILILDEPTSGLDFKNMKRISEHLQALAQKGKTIIIITHDYEFAMRTCNKVLHMINESKVECFSTEEELDKVYSCFLGEEFVYE